LIATLLDKLIAERFVDNSISDSCGHVNLTEADFWMQWIWRLRRSGGSLPRLPLHARISTLPGDYGCFLDDSSDPDNNIVTRVSDFACDPEAGFHPEPDTYTDPYRVNGEIGT